MVAGGGGRGLRDGATNAARLGASLQRVGAGGLGRPAPAQWPAAALVGRAAGQGGGMGGAGSGPGAGRRGALALRRPAAADHAGVCRLAARAHGGQAVAQAVVPTAVGASAAPAKRARGASGFQRGFADLMTDALPPEAAGKPVEIWFTDEARVGQQGTLTRVWAKRGSRPRAPRDRRYEWAYLFGAICPERRTGAAIIMPEVNLEAMNEHLAEISRRVSVGAIALLVLDGAGWHSSPRRLGPGDPPLRTTSATISTSDHRRSDARVTTQRLKSCADCDLYGNCN